MMTREGLKGGVFGNLTLAGMASVLLGRKNEIKIDTNSTKMTHLFSNSREIENNLDLF